MSLFSRPRWPQDGPVGYNGAMAMPSFFSFLPPLAAGLLLATAGWSGASLGVAPSFEYQPQLVVRPADTTWKASGDLLPQADPKMAGRFSYTRAGFQLELRPSGWTAAKVDVNEPRGMTTARATPSRAAVAISVKGDQKAQATVLELPKKTKLKPQKGAVRLEPGRHELLVQADGYIPKRLSLNLEPGERREVAMDLEAIPGLPTLGPAPGLPGLPAGGLPGSAMLGGPSAPPQTYRHPDAYIARPSYQQPAYQAPVVRFTPVAPASQPAPSEPVPMFTPIGNTP